MSYFPEKHNAGQTDQRNDTLWLTSDQVKAQRLHLRTGAPTESAPRAPEMPLLGREARAQLPSVLRGTRLYKATKGRQWC